MSFNLEDLRGPITSILTAPGVDLGSISAKRVRKELLVNTDLGLTARELKERRTEVDTLISGIYESVRRQAQEDGSKRKRDEETDEGTAEQEDQQDTMDTGEEQGEGDDKPPPPKKKKNAKQDVDGDAELARKLSSEINSRSRRATSSGAATPKKRKTKKSAKIVDSGDEDEGEEKPKKKRSGGARGGFAKEYMLRCFKYPCFTPFVPCHILIFFPILQRISVGGCWREQALTAPSREETMGVYSWSSTSKSVQQA